MKNNPDKKEDSDILPDDLLKDIAQLKGGTASPKPVPVPASILYPVTAAVAAEKRRKVQEMIATINGSGDSSALIGQEIPGHGVFIGTWQPEGLSQQFNIFAAPEDLTDTADKKEVYKYVDAVTRIAELKNWHGYNGTNYANKNEIHQALKDGSYIKNGSGWFIPPSELLRGTDANRLDGIRPGKMVQRDNLYTHKDKGALCGTFSTVGSDSYAGDWYWSSTEDHFNPSLLICTIGFSNGNEAWAGRDGDKRSCRPVRLELKP